VTAWRVKPDAKPAGNLYLAGDWTLNGLNAGCVEAAVMSSMQAARAISAHCAVISNSLAGIAPPGVAAFILCQCAGMLAAVRWLTKIRNSPNFPPSAAIENWRSNPLDHAARDCGALFTYRHGSNRRYSFGNLVCSAGLLI
jgi:hypothetical protein